MENAKETSNTIKEVELKELYTKVQDIIVNNASENENINISVMFNQITKELITKKLREMNENFTNLDAAEKDDIIGKNLKAVKKIRQQELNKAYNK